MTLVVKNLPAKAGHIRDDQMFKLDLEKAEEPEIQLPASLSKSKSSSKTSTSAL